MTRDLRLTGNNTTNKKSPQAIICRGDFILLQVLSGVRHKVRDLDVRGFLSGCFL